jgi:DNA-binding SARP family transcriptional activator
MVRISVLGPLRAEVDGAVVDLGGPRQRGVLALLLASRGAVVPVDRMIEDLWGGEAPARAIASLQAYVSNLRRALEPDRPVRRPARILISAAPGYAIRLDPGAVDAWEFEQRVTQARAGSDGVAALALLDDALQLWQGRAYAEFADEHWALAEVARLDEAHLAARTLQATLTLRADPPAAVPLAEQLTRSHPLHEEVWRLHALALWGSSRPADALAALRRARTTLADELGLDPGPALIELEHAILNQQTQILNNLIGRTVSAPVPLSSTGCAMAPRSSWLSRASRSPHHRSRCG